jgi:hypothetical protein
MCIRVIVKSASPQTTKRKHHLLRRSKFSVTPRWPSVFRTGGGEATYQKCVHIVLENQIGRNVKAYIDDIVVKSKKHGDLLDNLKETFNNLCKYKMLLNLNKYIFDVSSGKLLGYMVSSRWIVLAALPPVVLLGL